MALLFTVVFAAASVVIRLAPHAPNIAPIGALALFVGTYLPRRWGWALPLIAMLVSDYMIGFYTPGVMASVYLSFAGITLIGWALRRQRSSLSIVAGALAGSTLFYLITNFAVWAYSDWYPHTLSGLLSSYALALPFFRNTAVGDVLYSAAFFGAYEAVRLAVRGKLTVPIKLGYGIQHSRH